MSEKHSGPSHSSPYGLSRLAPSISLVETAKEIQHADMMIGAVTSAKLHTIAEQIRFLQEQARDILAQAKTNLDMHTVQCSFVRRPGKTYHMYEKDDGSRYWSIISPAEWGADMRHVFRGSFRLEPDQSWTTVDSDVIEAEFRHREVP